MIPAGVLLLGIVSGSPGATVHTSTADVRDCAFSEAGDIVLAATSGGLVTMSADGRDARTLTSVDGLPGTRALALLPASDDQWWVGTEGGLARLRLAAGIPEVLERIEGPPVRALALDDDDGLLVGTWGEGLLRLDNGQLHPISFTDGEPSAARLRVTDLVRFDGTWVVATAAGLWRGDAHQGLSRWSTELDDTVVWSLAGDEHQLWVGTLDGLYRGHDRLRSVAPIDARDVAVHNGTIHVATMGEGLRSFEATTATPADAEHDHGLMIRATDHAGPHRCVATDDGLWLDDGPDTTATVALRSELPSNDISAAVWDEATERLWVGTFDRGLAYHDQDGWHRVRAPEIDPQVNGLAVQHTQGRSILWIATARGLARLDGDDVQAWTRKAGLPHEHVQSIAVVGDRIVAGTARGFVTIEDGTLVKPDRRRKPERWAVWSIAGDDDGTLWLGTTEGLVEWPSEGPWRRHSMLEGTLPDNWITSVHIDGNALWVGTYAAGVVHLKRDDDDALQPTELDGGRVNPDGLGMTPSHVYASTMGGLIRRPRRPSGRWTSLTKRIPGTDTTAVVPTPQGLWIATRRGLALIEDR